MRPQKPSIPICFDIKDPVALAAEQGFALVSSHEICTPRTAWPGHCLQSQEVAAFQWGSVVWDRTNYINCKISLLIKCNAFNMRYENRLHGKSETAQEFSLLELFRALHIYWKSAELLNSSLFYCSQVVKPLRAFFVVYYLALQK